MKKHSNIPIFIPHVGCPNACVFCNQRKISGHLRFEKHGVRRELETAFSTVDSTRKTQIAYFGGSFTGIGREDMTELLSVAGEYIDRGLCESVRISTRPDYIDRETLEILRKYRVESIELGIQSTDDAVLCACKRGHTAEDSFRAAALVKEYGFELVGQMMVGLPCATEESERRTALDICRMGADGARIYPTVVFADTELADMTANGSYQPLTEETSVLRAANALKIFVENGVPVIRLGLQSGETLESGDGVVAGGYHPAVGELAYSHFFRDMLENSLSGEKTEGKTALVRAHVSDVSKIIGQRGANRNYLMQRFLLKELRVVSDGAAEKNHPTVSII